MQTYGLADKSVRPTRALVLTFHEKAGCTKNGASLFFRSLGIIELRAPVLVDLLESVYYSQNFKLIESRI